MDWDWPKIEEFAWDYGLKVLNGLITLIVGWIVARIVRSVLHRILRRADVDESLVGFLGSLTYMLLMTFVVIATLGEFGMRTDSFVAIIAAAGLAIGFALQGSLSNFAAGVMIIVFRPFRAGDFIEGGGTEGVVERILVFNTVLRTPDNKTIIVPNARMTGGNIINYSAKATRRVDMVFGIGYDDDIQQAKAVLEKILADHELVLSDPAPQVAVAELADSRVNFNVRPWAKTEDHWTVYSDVSEAVKLEFDKQGLSIK